MGVLEGSGQSFCEFCVAVVHGPAERRFVDERPNDVLYPSMPGYESLSITVCLSSTRVIVSPSSFKESFVCDFVNVKNPLPGMIALALRTNEFVPPFEFSSRHWFSEIFSVEVLYNSIHSDSPSEGFGNTSCMRTAAATGERGNVNRLTILKNNRETREGNMFCFCITVVVYVILSGNTNRLY